MNNQKFNKVFKIVYISLLVVAALMTVWYVFVSAGKDCLACTLPSCEAFTEDGQSYYLPADDCAKPYAELGEGAVECSEECLSYAGTYLTFTIALIIIALVSMALMAVYSLVNSSKKMAITTIVIGGLVILILLVSAFILASNEIPEILGFNGEISIFDVKMTDTLLYTTYLLLGASVLAIFSSAVIKYLRK